MKHVKGNSPKCSECKYYRERLEGEKLSRGDGWCVNQKAQGINGHRPLNPKNKVEVLANGTACRLWIDAEAGYTIFEVMTGYKEPYDGSKIEQLN